MEGMEVWGENIQYQFMHPLQQYLLVWRKSERIEWVCYSLLSRQAKKFNWEDAQSSNSHSSYWRLSATFSHSNIYRFDWIDYYAVLHANWSCQKINIRSPFSFLLSIREFSHWIWIHQSTRRRIYFIKNTHFHIPLKIIRSPQQNKYFNKTFCEIKCRWKPN